MPATKVRGRDSRQGMMFKGILPRDPPSPIIAHLVMAHSAMNSSAD